MEYQVNESKVGVVKCKCNEVLRSLSCRTIKRATTKWTYCKWNVALGALRKCFRVDSLARQLKQVDNSTCNMWRNMPHWDSHCIMCWPMWPNLAFHPFASKTQSWTLKKKHKIMIAWIQVQNNIIHQKHYQNQINFILKIEQKVHEKKN